MWQQWNITLSSRRRGFHLVSAEILRQSPALQNCSQGMLHLLLQHTSASLCLGENADPTVRADFESYFRKVVPDEAPYYQHTLEGPDDITAHVKSALLGVSLLLPVTNGQLNLGTWQGIYLGEHREHGGSRRILATLQGE